MSTIVNNPGSGNEESSSTGILVGIFIVVVIAIFFIYGLPAMRGNQRAPQNDSVNVNVKLPPAIDVIPTPTPTPEPTQN